MKKDELIKVSIEDKKNYILENEKIKGEVREFLNRYNKLETELELVLDNIIVTNKLNYKCSYVEFDNIKKLVNEMESILNERNTGTDERNSTNKS